MKKGLFFCCFLVSLTSFAQSALQFGWLPKVNVSAKLNANTKWVNSVEAREVVYDDDFQFAHSLVDVSSIVSFKTNLNQSINVGYIFRVKDNQTIHRLIQHYNHVQPFSNFKLAHRLGFEQFYQNNEKPQYRTRYRATFQKPLNGEKVDVKEWYLKLGNEYLYQFNTEAFELRVSPYLGYKISAKDKIEFGLDYRLGNVFDAPTKNNLWFRTTWYISL